VLKLFKLVCAKISENDSALRRGRIPAHEMKEVMNVSLMLLRAKARFRTSKPKQNRHNKIKVSTRKQIAMGITYFVVTYQKLHDLYYSINYFFEFL
jgi:hypothetical protein